MKQISDLLKENSIEIETLICLDEENSIKMKCDVLGDEVSFSSDTDEMYFSMSVVEFFSFVEQLKCLREFLSEQVKENGK